MAGTSSGNAETCMVKNQIPVPCGGQYAAPRYAVRGYVAPPARVYGPPAYVYEEPAYATPAYGYRAPVYATPAYDDYYDGGYYDDGYYDNSYYGYYGTPYFAPSITIGGFFGDFDGHHGHHHGGGHRWHHRH
jgi:hypothetical protein